MRGRVVTLGGALVCLALAISCRGREERALGPMAKGLAVERADTGEPERVGGEAASGNVGRGKALYEASCIGCHGTDGSGKTPMGRMTGAKDLLARRGALSDGEIAETIKAGKGRMPAFDLPPEAIRDVVAYVRALGR